MHIKKHIILFICYTIILNGCGFAPQKRSKSPHFDGIIKFNDERVNNAKVMLSIAAGDKFCLKAKRFTSTNNRGEFNLKAITEESDYTPFVSYELNEWTVCAVYNDQTYTLYSNNQYDTGNVTGSVYLQCELVLRPASQPCLISH
jgi:hypothetical protein